MNVSKGLFTKWNMWLPLILEYGKVASRVTTRTVILRS